MFTNVSRRCFLKSTAAGVLSSGALAALAERLSAATATPALGPKSKVRIGKLYLGREHPGWPMAKVDVNADMKRFEANLAKLGAGLADVEFIEGGLIANDQQLAAAKEKFKGADGILVIHLTMGIGSQLQSLFELGIPVVLFALPYSGHEWHTIAGWQRQGKLIEVFPSSKYEDVLVAIRPFRAIHRLKEARLLNVSNGPADAAYCQALKEKFGTEVISLTLPDLQKAYAAADRGRSDGRHAAVGEGGEEDRGADEGGHPQVVGDVYRDAGPAGAARRGGDHDELPGDGFDGPRHGLSVPRFRAVQQHGAGRHLRGGPEVQHDAPDLHLPGGQAGVRDRPGV